MADEPLEEIEELHLRSALSYALQTVKLPRRRTKPPFDHDADKAERDIAVDAILAQLKLNKWRVMHAPLARAHANPDPFGARLRVLRQLRGHLSELRVACPRCTRQGVYNLEKQISQHGPDKPILDWLLRAHGELPGSPRDTRGMRRRHDRDGKGAPPVAVTRRRP
jgi:hypothetical protein